MKRYVGHPSQLFEVRQYTMTDGKADGTRAIQIWNGKDLTYTVIPDRCLDIADVRYKGMSMAYITPCGIVNSKYFEADGTNWLRSFFGGFLTTCGLQNIGSPDETPELTMHGRIANTPCENLCIELDPDGLGANIKGTVREAVLFGCKLTLKRNYRCNFAENKISFIDTITNEGYERVPVSILYHMNAGYPLLSENAKLVIPSTEVQSISEHAENHISEWREITPPAPEFSEMCYYHRLSENCYGIDNPDIGVRMRISFASNGLLDRLVQWKMLGVGEYVMGLEAASSTIEGRADAIKNGSQKYIMPGQKYVNRFSIEFEELK